MAPQRATVDRDWIEKNLGATPADALVRNVSDTQVDAPGLALRDQARVAGNIDKAYGRWSNACVGALGERGM